MGKELTLAQKLHTYSTTQMLIEDAIESAFNTHEPEIGEMLEFGIGSDDYDNSIEIYFHISLPYPYEPCKEIRQIIYDMGFSIVFWNFLKDTQDVVCDRLIGQEPKLMKESPDEIRGWEPRHNKNAHWTQTKYGYVDDRFNEKDWKRKYNFK